MFCKFAILRVFDTFFERIWPLAQCDWLEFFPCSGFEPLPTMEPTFGQPYEGWDSALTSPLCQSKPLFRIKTLALFQIFTPLSQPSGLENVSSIMRGSRCERLALECSQALISPFTGPGPGARGAAVTLASTSREVWLRHTGVTEEWRRVRVRQSDRGDLNLTYTNHIDR